MRCDWGKTPSVSRNDLGRKVQGRFNQGNSTWLNRRAGVSEQLKNRLYIGAEQRCLTHPEASPPDHLMKLDGGRGVDCD
jgi:hypothetical protein